MKIDVLTIFPEMFTPLDSSIIGRARQAGLVDITVTDIRPFSKNKHRNTDDYPYGGGAGMLMMAQPIADAICEVAPEPYPGLRILLSPRGKPLTQAMVAQLAQQPALLLLCGHYEGVDERVISRYIDMEVSIGDYILTGGELPAMVLIDCVTRLLDGVLGCGLSTQDESFSADGLLEYPQFTRPGVFKGMQVPDVLLSGDHARIKAWRREQALSVTAKLRPDLLEKACLSQSEREWVNRLLKAGE